MFSIRFIKIGAASDNNAFLFFEGAWSVLQPTGTYDNGCTEVKAKQTNVKNLVDLEYYRLPQSL